jgi:hypothetical protein
MQYATTLNPSLAPSPAEHNLASVSSFDSATDSNCSGVSWSAVFAGAAAAAVISLLLFILGFGLGLSSLSPWRNEGIEGATLGRASIAWVAFTQIAASALGGYLAGRLRVKWARLHGDEVYFRDTAHGFLAWAIASLLTVALLGSVTTAVATGGIKAGAAVATASTALAAPAIAGAVNSLPENGNNESAAIDYYVDNLFHVTPTPSEPGAAPSEKPALEATERTEVVRIFAHSLANGELRAEDKSYLSQLLARHTGMTEANAEIRVSAVYNQTRENIEQAKTKAQQAIDKTRKIAAYSALWMFIALLCGAFVASVTALWGGRQRDSARDVVV